LEKIIEELKNIEGGEFYTEDEYINIDNNSNISNFLHLDDIIKIVQIENVEFKGRIHKKKIKDNFEKNEESLVEENEDFDFSKKIKRKK
jgi:hypothetical protein